MEKAWKSKQSIYIQNILKTTTRTALFRKWVGSGQNHAINWGKSRLVNAMLVLQQCMY